MRRVALPLCSAAVAVIALVAPGLPQAQAASIGAGPCTRQLNTQCADLFRDHIARYQPVFAWPKSNGQTAQQWDAIWTGKLVSGPRCTPYKNCAYDWKDNGRGIFQIKLRRDHHWCLGTDQGPFSFTRADLQACSGAWGVNWVIVRYTLRNVNTVNRSGNYNRVLTNVANKSQLRVTSWNGVYSQWTWRV